jgi:phage-related tail protein
MNKNLSKMRGVALATNSIRKSLKEQEETNKEYRNQITPIWDDKSMDKTVTALSQQLATGRAKVRAYQTALHELKKSFRNYNKRYDRSLRHTAQ